MCSRNAKRSKGRKAKKAAFYRGADTVLVADTGANESFVTMETMELLADFKPMRRYVAVRAANGSALAPWECVCGHRMIH